MPDGTETRRKSEGASSSGSGDSRRGTKKSKHGDSRRDAKRKHKESHKDKKDKKHKRARGASSDSGSSDSESSRRKRRKTERRERRRDGSEKKRKHKAPVSIISGLPLQLSVRKTAADVAEEARRSALLQLLNDGL
jgi:hypothetical protein